uniref:Uncharacterized protein n=1 Tax=Arion vulgaris TaxID=1028688 RepID=A0A0B7AE55_9EUPU
MLLANFKYETWSPEFSNPFNEAINLVRVEVDFVQNDVILGNPSNSDDNSLKSSKC